MRPIVSLLLVALLAAPCPVSAEDQPAAPTAKRVGLPQASLSFLLQPGWQITQFDGAVVDLSNAGARIWVYEGRGSEASRRINQYAERAAAEGTKPVQEPWRMRGIRDAARVWYDTQDAHRLVGAFTRDDDSNMDVEVLVPKGNKLLLAQVRTTLDSFDANPFENPKRLVNWQQGWTMEFGSDWEAKVPYKDFVRLVHRKNKGFKAFVRMRTEGSLSAKLDFGPEMNQFVEESAVTGSDGVVRVDWRHKSESKSIVHGWFRTQDRLESVLVYPADHAPEDAVRAKAMLRTVRPGTEPGPQRDLAKERSPNHFPSERGPKLTFKLPSRWSLTKPTSNMRLAQFQIPGNPPLFGVVYFFNAGSGGSLEANMERWKGQLKDPVFPGEPVSIKVAEGITATTLDMTGTYNAQVRPGAPERVNKPNYRMLATYLTLDGGPIMIKLVGPKAAVAKAASAYFLWLRTFRVKK